MSGINAIVVGGGARGRAYGRYALAYPDEFEVVGVAEPDPLRRARFATEHDIAPHLLFEDWESFAETGGQQAHAVLNCTMDRQHYASTMRLLDLGYDVLLEKPMSPVLHENVKLVQKAEEKGQLLQICHVLRYSPFWETLKQVVDSGVLGDIISITHRENLHFLHMAHSFVRGNWRNAADSGPMILSKCCHDFDILLWLLKDEVVWLNSFGTMTHFRPENAPEGATLRCTDGCPAAERCKYEATRVYADTEKGWWPVSSDLYPTRAARIEALKTGWYGRCVYHCDNDVVDHQTVNMEMASGTTVTLVMNGQGDEECRTMRWDGTKATLYGKFSSKGDEITIHHHRTGEIEQVEIIHRDQSGHGGGDFGIVRSFLNAMNGRPDDRITTARESLESHLLAFAAEESRLHHSIIHMPTYRERINAEARQ